MTASACAALPDHPAVNWLRNLPAHIPSCRAGAVQRWPPSSPRAAAATGELMVCWRAARRSHTACWPVRNASKQISWLDFLVFLQCICPSTRGHSVHLPRADACLPSRHQCGVCPCMRPFAGPRLPVVQTQETLPAARLNNAPFFADLQLKVCCLTCSVSQCAKRSCRGEGRLGAGAPAPQAAAADLELGPITNARCFSRPQVIVIHSVH